MTGVRSMDEWYGEKGAMRVHQQSECKLCSLISSVKVRHRVLSVFYVTLASLNHLLRNRYGKARGRGCNHPNRTVSSS